MTCGFRKEVIMRKQTRHRFVATNYNHYKCLLPFLLYNSYCTKFAQQRKGKLAKTKIFLSLTSGVCFFALIFENYHTIPLAQNEIHLQLQLKSPIQDDGALVLYIKATINLVRKNCGRRKTMTVGDILVSINQASLETMLPLTAVQTSADIERYYKEGYSVGLTANEFAKKYPRLPVDRIYAAHNMLAPLYYCELDSTTVPIVLSLNIYGDKRLAVNSESDEKFQQRILDMAEKISSGNAPFIRSYLFSLGDSLRVSVLSKYIELSSPGENLYALFLDFYRTSDFGFSALKEENLQKVFSGKSQKQKQNTEKKLSSLPDIVTIYRGEGSKSTPYEKSFSWTTSYKAACFFACRIPSLENSRIITAHINKSDIIEYFPDDEEKEVLVPPAAVKDRKVDTLYGINALIDEIQALYPLYQRYRSRISTLYDAYGRANDEEHNAEHTLRVLFDALLLVQVQGIALTKKESHQLCDAILYHDIGRTNDDVDDSHGAKSRDIYYDTASDCNSATAFLIEYHCLDDRKALADLKVSNIRDKERVWLLYTILKDADALDRVRFGMRAVDPKYFRNEITHKLLPTAQSCVGQLKL